MRLSRVSSSLYFPSHPQMSSHQYVDGYFFRERSPSGSIHLATALDLGTEALASQHSYRRQLYVPKTSHSNPILSPSTLPLQQNQHSD
ncbi:hypothetical protein ccbrp13_55000 [Ktedonobacteria bacterium brp13]|nr:hypothetical protein ccbrp13_55000 [Ktedonobacteria bacterium brp13]